MNDYNVNLNSAECLKSMTHFGFDRVHNICTGAVIDVPWGMFEYATVLLAFALACCLFFLVVLVWRL